MQQRVLGIENKQAYYLEYRLRRADGVYRWHSAHVAPVRDVYNEVVGWYGSGLDIDDQRRNSEKLRESEARFRAVFESAAIGVARVSFDGARWLEMNEAFCRILGYRREELVGQPWPEITHPDDIHVDMESFEKMARGEIETYTVEKRFFHKQGHCIWARLTLSLVRDASGKPDFEVCLLENITERKEAEERLRRSNDDWQRFSYMVSHDLQEPLRQVTTMAQLIVRRFGSSDERACEMADLIVAGSQRMQTIIRDLLLLADSRREVPFECFASEEVVQDAIATVQHHIDQTGAQITIEPPLPRVFAPRSVLRQVFQNLISNALKYRDERRPPEIHIRGYESDGHATFSVADNGQGIPPEYRNRLFQWLSRVPGTKAVGNGIGLASIARMLEWVGGRIWVDSEVGTGSTFYFTIPIREQRAADCETSSGDLSVKAIC